MTENNDNLKQTDSPEPSACGPGCCCNAGGSSGRMRWIVGAIVLVAAGALMARAVMKNYKTETAKTETGFASLPGIVQPPAAGAAPSTNEIVAMSVKEIDTLAELNALAVNMDGVLVFVPGKNDPPILAPLTPMRGAVKTMAAGGSKIALFKLKPDSRDYGQVATQMPVPGVIAMVKGRGMSAVSGDITETKLIQTYLAAASCGPGSGCGPGGCK